MYLLFVCLIFSKTADAQIYYNPNQSIDLTVTIKEPYKPINYAEIADNFTSAIKQAAARRDALKRYYDDIAYETKNSIYSNTILTNDYSIDNKILILQQEAIDDIYIKHTLLKSGQLNPRVYENSVRDIYYSFMRANREMLQRFIMNKNKIIIPESLPKGRVNLGDLTSRQRAMYYEGALFNGVGYSVYSSGQLKFEVNYKDGKLDGLWILWWENGQLRTESNWKDGELDGLAKSWYEDGQLKFEINYKDGEYDGLYRTWDEDGQLASEKNYKDGVEL